MGTRSLTHIYSAASDALPLVTLYRQYDGYPSGMGEDIKKALGGRKLVNGFNDAETQCNGMGCAAAMLIGALKAGKCGNVYVEKAGASDRGEEYTYRLYPNGDRFRLTIHDGGTEIYDGYLHEFDAKAVEGATA